MPAKDSLAHHDQQHGGGGQSADLRTLTVDNARRAGVIGRNLFCSEQLAVDGGWGYRPLYTSVPRALMHDLCA